MIHGGARSGSSERGPITSPKEQPTAGATAELPLADVEGAEWMAYWVLVLGEGGSRLYKGLRESLSPVVGHTFPIRRTDLTAFGPPRSAAAEEESLRDAAHFAFMQSVDRRLHAFLRAEPRPLVLAGSGRSLASFSCLTRQRDLIIGCLLGDFVATPSSDLARLVWPLVLAARVRGSIRLRVEPRAPQFARWLVHTPGRRERAVSERATLHSAGERGIEVQPVEALDGRSGRGCQLHQR